MRRILVIGGAGFIGSNLSNYLLNKQKKVVIYDNLSRNGTRKNLEWLKTNHSNLSFHEVDVRDYGFLRQSVRGFDVVYHLAGQVAVTTSMVNPREDFEVNALGTLNVLEAVRKSNPEAIVVFTSTNKVYGKMSEVNVIERDGHYDYEDQPYGISEFQPLDFYSPYGCSKGSADQYIHDYSRIYGIRTVVFRMSCIYGTRQFGNEDQGWIMHFVISSIFNKSLNIFGDGKQVRDILFVDDLVIALESVIKKIDVTQGQVYNIGGGRENVISLLELINYLKGLTGKSLDYSFNDWRPGDQKVYISDIRKAQRDFDWKPGISKEEGVERLFQWVRDNQELFQ